MVVVMRDRIADLIAKKKTLAEIKAARPGLPFETRYGAKTGTWTTDMFIDAVYNSLRKAS
jgi:hypothetical protein